MSEDLTAVKELTTPVKREPSPRPRPKATAAAMPQDIQGATRDVLARIAEIIEPDEDIAKLHSAENRYIEKHPDRDNLQKRYDDETSSEAAVTTQIGEHGMKPLLDKLQKDRTSLSPWELYTLVQSGQLKKDDLTRIELPIYDSWAGTRGLMEKQPGEHEFTIIQKALEEQVGLLFLNKEFTGSSYNPDKYKMVLAQTKGFLNLISLAQSQGQLPGGITAGDIFSLTQENIWALSFQDRQASKNLLGDHGVRHLVGHNIRVSMELADRLEKQGVPLSALDRLMLHTIMMYHDLGYAMPAVSEPMRREGIKDQDAGHNVLAAQFVRERVEDPKSLWHKLFRKDDLALIHQNILYHDRGEDGTAKVEFGSDRRKNIEAIVRTADNTHAFEDKLPELLYQHPATLKYMRLLKTAGEIGDVKALSSLKLKLAGEIQDRDDLSNDDKDALVEAAMSLNEKSYKFTVGRICGNKPEYAIVRTESGQLQVRIDVQESEIHQETMKLFDMAAYEQLLKFIVDNTGFKREEIETTTDKIEAGSLAIQIHKDVHNLSLRTDYQKQVEKLLMGDAKFVEFARGDNVSSAQQKVAENVLLLFDNPQITDTMLFEQAETLINIDASSSRQTIHTALENHLNQIQSARRDKLSSYLTT